MNSFIKNYKNPMMIKQKKLKSKLKKRFFETYEYLYTLNPTLDLSDMDESVLKKIQYILMKELTGYPEGYRNIPVALHDGDGHVSYQPPAFAEVPRLMQAYFAWLYTSVTGYSNPYDTTIADF
ncbi:hypothetical protein ACFTAO_39510 [Paenibacillus rhizoplanae]